jgi:hypothetical protein
VKAGRGVKRRGHRGNREKKGKEGIGEKEVWWMD